MRYTVPFALISLMILISCSAPAPVEDPNEYLSATECASGTREIAFALSNPGNFTVGLDNTQEGLTRLAIEINNVELTGLPSYCGREILLPHETARCRRPGESKTDAGIELNTGRKLLFFPTQNSIRVKVGESTKEIQMSCK